MSGPIRRGPAPSRRGFLGAAGGLAASGAGALLAPGAPAAAAMPAASGSVPFWGAHQGGIVTPQQGYTYFAAFDLVAASRANVIGLLRAWTNEAARLAASPTTPGTINDGADSGVALGLTPARLTITFGFGPGLFTQDGKDRYGLAARRPAALVDLPRFNGDQLAAAQSGGDMSVQACADDPQVAFHAVRQLARLAGDAASPRWAQTGFLASQPGGGTPRNLMGFKDGTNNPNITRAPDMAQIVWAGTEAPAWMQGGSYLVARRIRMALEHWDNTKVAFQEQVIGRHKASGAPLGAQHEFAPLDLAATDADGNAVIPDTAHVRLAAPQTNHGAQVLRRGYSYNDGLNLVAERWPPWRQGLEYDAGLFFLCYQRDPRSGFLRVFDQMSKLDMLNQFTTHVGSGIFACPPGARPGFYIGQALLEA